MTRSLSRTRLEELDLIAKRYGHWPSEVLKMDLDEFQFNHLVCCVGSEADKKAGEKAAKEQQRLYNRLNRRRR